MSIGLVLGNTGSAIFSAVELLVGKGHLLKRFSSFFSSQPGLPGPKGQGVGSIAVEAVFIESGLGIAQSKFFRAILLSGATRGANTTGSVDLQMTGKIRP